jgi:hypothetical protein
MGIHMVQDFCFETDDLKYFEAVLRAVAPTLFDFKHSLPKILVEAPSDWRDARYEDTQFTRQSSRHDLPFTFDNSLVGGEGFSTLALDGCYHGAVKLKVHGTHKDLDEASRASCAEYVEPRPLRMWIATIFDSQYMYESLKPKDYFTCKSWDLLATEVMRRCMTADAVKFREDFQHVEEAWFDGSYGTGFRMEARPCGGEDLLDISMVHMWYGK